MTEPVDIVAETTSLAAARQSVLDRIAAACRRAGREPADVTLVAVSKTVSAERLVAAIEAGLSLLGENRVQEAAAKAPTLAGATWQLIGPLQSNKARRALEVFASIQTVDSVELATRLDRLVPEVHPGVRYPVLVQVNVDEDPAKAGVAPAALEVTLDQVLALPNLRVDGLMTVGRFTTDQAAARQTFRGLRELAAAARSQRPELGSALSMGMSDDFELAVEEGATIVRVGRALFGDRPHRHDDGPLDHRH